MLLAWQRMSEMMKRLLGGVRRAAGMQREARNWLSVTKDKKTSSLSSLPRLVRCYSPTGRSRIVSPSFCAAHLGRAKRSNSRTVHQRSCTERPSPHTYCTTKRPRGARALVPYQSSNAARVATSRARRRKCIHEVIALGVAALQHTTALPYRCLRHKGQKSNVVARHVSRPTAAS
jgi:hypothetical protein